MRRLVFFLYFALMTMVSNAQVVEFTPMTGNLDDFNNQLFQNVDLTQVPTGFLLDRSIAFADPELYTGRRLTDSTNLDLSKFSLLYGVLRGAAINNTVLPAAQTYLSNSNVTGGSNALLLLANRISFIHAEALQNNLFSVAEDQLYDVVGRTQSPYVTDTVFAATCARYDFKSLNVSFTLPTDRIISNFDAPVSNRQFQYPPQYLSENSTDLGVFYITQSYFFNFLKFNKNEKVLDFSHPIAVFDGTMHERSAA